MIAWKYHQKPERWHLNPEQIAQSVIMLAFTIFFVYIRIKMHCKKCCNEEDQPSPDCICNEEELIKSHVCYKRASYFLITGMIVITIGMVLKWYSKTKEKAMQRQLRKCA
uniref:Uncharacterized protein n=1 Tax=Fibrocapsa japonica TaxID=94617 RepID=A0A7S2V9F2_9STRA